MNANIHQIPSIGMVNPYIFQIKSQSETPIITNIIPDTDFTISISCDTEFFKYRNENGKDQNIYICGQFKETNQIYTSLHIHPDLNNQKFQDKIPCKYTHNIKFNRDLVENKIVDYRIKDSSKSLLQHELKRLTGKDFLIIPKKIKRSENVESKSTGKKKLPIMTLKLYMFFGIVDYRGILGYEGDNLIVKTLDYYHTRKNNPLTYRKYLNSGINGKNYLPFNNLIIRIKNPDGSFQDCLLNLEIIDIFASLGPTSYLKYSKLVGHKLDFKDTLSNDDKRDMLTFMSENPDDFLNYSLGDCECETMFKKYCSKLKDICQVLGIEYKKPKLSIGGTVASILSSFIEKKTGFSKKDLELFLNFTAKKLKQFKGTTEILNSLIYGGRCISNNGRVTLLNLSILIDIDLDGAYNNILNCLGLKFFICKGKPEIYNIPIDNPKQLRNIRENPEIIERCMTLREYLKINQKNFVPFGYQIIVISDSDDMKYKQDFFISKYKFQIKNVDNVDTLKEKTGETKVFLNDIHIGIICHTSLELLLNDPNDKYVSYMLDHLRVLTAAYYHKDYQVTDISQLENDDKNWLSIPICELSSKIQSLRKIYKKGTPENNLYKLIANTIYGVLASPWFDTSNPITANSITDAIRSACYIVEKRVNGIKSITDGCQIDINNVIVSNDNQNNMTMSNLVGANYLTDRELSHRHLKRQSLINGNWKVTTIDVDILDKNTDDYVFKGISENDLINIEILPNYEVIYNYGLIDENTNKLYDKKQINQLILDYCFQDYQYLPICSEYRKSGNPTTQGSQDNFLHNHNDIDYFINPEIIKGLVGIEIKNIYTTGVFHSSANYMLETLHHKQVIAYRSIKSKGYQLVIDDNLQQTPDIETPRNTFFNAIANDLKAVPRSEIYYKSDILSPNMYAVHKEKLDCLGISIGDNLPCVGYLKEFSYTSFLYKNYREYCLVKNECEKLKRKYGQSYEMFYQNKDGTINYDAMMAKISYLVSKGLDGVSIYKYLLSEIKISENDKYHPNFNRLNKLKNKLLSKWIDKNNHQNNSVNDLDLDFDNIEFWDNDTKSEYLDDSIEIYQNNSLDFDGNIEIDF